MVAVLVLICRPISWVVLSGSLVTLCIHLRPIFGVSQSSESSRSGYERGLHYEMIEAFVPNFGRYRSARGELELSLQLYAYRKFLQAALPCIEQAAEAASSEA